MGRGVANYTITKELILSKVSEEAIFSAYTGLDISVIEDCVERGKLISSPYRVDRHPSFGFYYNKHNRLIANDFAGYFRGDCFDAVAYVLKSVYGECDICKDFRRILQNIAFTFRDIIYGMERDPKVSDMVSQGLAKIRRKKSVIEFTGREWNEDDIAYWSQFGITLPMLNTNYVYPVDEFWINRDENSYRKYSYNRNDPCYAYVLGRDTTGVYNTKLYFPKREHGTMRFITNTACIEGLLGFNYDFYDMVIITKSTKDRLALLCYLERNPVNKVIGVINLSSESYKLRQVEWEYIRSKCPISGIYSLMDNDRAGMNMAAWLRRNYGVAPLLIPHSYGVKDFAELASKYDDYAIEQLINQSFNSEPCKKKLMDNLPY